MLDRVARDAPEHDRERFGDDLRRLAEGLGRLPCAQRLVDLLRRGRSSGPSGALDAVGALTAQFE